MIKHFITIFTVLFASMIYAQEGRVGINTTNPKTTMDVNGKTANMDGSGTVLTTDMTGLQAPRLTRKELTDKGNSLYGSDQKGAMIYITDVSAGDNLSQRINVTSIGYYYFDGNVWVKFVSPGIEPWNIQGTSNPATSNTQNIYQTGKVAINTNTTDKQLEVAGDFKTKYANGTYNSSIENNFTDFGIPMNISYVSNNADLASATETDLMVLRPGVANIQSNNGDNGSSIGVFSSAMGGDVGLVANKDDITTSIWGLNNTSLSHVSLSNKKQNAEGSTVLIEKMRGISFFFENTGGSAEGKYTFPRNNGAANQVLLTDGNSVSATLKWASFSEVTALDGVTLKSSGGSCFKIIVSDSGVLSTTAVACP